MSYLHRSLSLIGFALFYFVDLMKANLKVMLDIFGVRQAGEPALYTFKTRCISDREYFILSNLITFTPGTICVEADPEAKTIEIHDMFHGDSEEARNFLREKYEKPLLYIISGREL